jgi:hypothetical protein
MTGSTPAPLWAGAVDGSNYRLFDRGTGAAPRFVLQVEQGPTSMGETYWTDVGLPLADVLEAAFAALYKP